MEKVNPDSLQEQIYKDLQEFGYPKKRSSDDFI